jgi:Zn-dependent M16 (insulinase) family peptidase
MQVTIQVHSVYCLSRLSYRDPDMFRSYKTFIREYTLVKENFTLHVCETIKR